VNEIEFPIRDLARGSINAERLKPYEVRYGIQQIVFVEGDIVMGDRFENISGSTIINKSLVQNSLNKVKEQYDEETSKALQEVAQFIHNSKNRSAGALFNEFNQELSKPEPDKSALGNLWSSIQNVLPQIVTISGAVAKIVTLFA
jgi:hypothetical protein